MRTVLPFFAQNEKLGGSPSLLRCIGTGSCCSPIFVSFVKLPASEFKEVVPAHGDLLQVLCSTSRSWYF